MSNFDPVPWLIEGGAVHSVQVGRNIAYAAFSGKEGIVGSKACEVREMGTPGTSVRVFPGTLGILNRDVGAFEEMYAGRLPTEDDVTIAATDASGGRSDMVVAIVKNPYAPSSPWGQPADPAKGPYIESMVISDVPSTATTVAELNLGYSALALARIDIPASTSVITQAMIKDLRKMSAVLTQHDTMVFGITGAATDDLTGATYGKFPNIAGCELLTDVPEWATHASVRAFIGGVKYGPGNVFGNARINLTSGAVTATGQATQYNQSNTSGSDRALMMAAAPSLALDPAIRGTTATVTVEATKDGGTTTMTADNSSMLTIEIDYLCLPESNL